MDPNLILNRLNRLVRLDTTVFDEVRDDPRELVPAIAIAAVSALLAGIGAWLWLALIDHAPLSLDYGNIFLKIILMGTIFAVVLWAVWAAVTYFVLTGFFHEEADLQAMVRTMGYASFPFALSLLMLIPGLSFGFGLAAVVLWFLMTIYAVQACTHAPSNRVIIANAAGFVVFALMMSIIARTSGLTTGVFLHTEGGKAMAEGSFYEAPSLDDLLNR